MIWNIQPIASNNIFFESWKVKRKTWGHQKFSEKQKQALLDSPEITTQAIENQTKAIQKSNSSLNE